MPLNLPALLRKLAIATLFALSAAAPAAAQDSKTTVRIGVTPGPHLEVAEFVKPILAKSGLTLEVVSFTDYIIPNEALSSGDLDVNSFQHQPFLDKQVADRGYKIESVAKTVVFPMGIYSKKFKSWKDVPDGATVAIPNDPTNGGRALLLLQANGTLKLKDGSGLSPTLLDIVDNPKKLKIIEIEAAQTIRTLDDVDAAAINTNYYVADGGNPIRDAILIEDANGPYANVIVVRSEDKDKPWLKTLIQTIQSPEVKKFVADRFKGSVLTAF